MSVATFFINFAAIFSSLINAQCYEFLVMCTDAALQPLHYGNQLLPSLWHRDLFPTMNSLDQFILLLVISSIFLNCKSKLTYLLDYLLFLSCLNRCGMSMRQLSVFTLLCRLAKHAVKQTLYFFKKNYICCLCPI